MVTFKFDLDGDNPEEIAQIMVQLSHFETRLLPFHHNSGRLSCIVFHNIVCLNLKRLLYNIKRTFMFWLLFIQINPFLKLCLCGMLDDVGPCFRWRASSSWRASASPSLSRSARSSRWLTTKEKAGRRVFLRYVAIASPSSQF